MKLIAGIAGAAVTEPEALVRFDTTNPVLGTLVAKAGPVTSLGRELATGKDFFGRELDGVDDYAREVASRVIPIAAQDVLRGEAPIEIPGEMAQVGGLRTWQISARDRLAYEMFGKSYTDLEDEPNKQRLIRFHPEVIGQRKYPGQKEVADIRSEQLTDDQMLRNKQITTREWWNRMYERLERAAIEQKKEITIPKPQTPIQKARNGYYTILEEIGPNPTSNEIRANRKKRDEFLASLPPELRDAVEEARWSWATPTMIEGKEALLKLEPYSAIADKWRSEEAGIDHLSVYNALQQIEIWRAEGNEAKARLYRTPKVQYAERRIRLEREYLRKRNPEIDDLLVKWFGLKPIWAR